MRSYKELVGLLENYIDFGNYNLYQKFHHYNQLLFHGQIPPCPITWGELKGVAGLTTYSHRGATYIPDTLKIQMSTRFKRTEEMLDSTLIHEMIHAYMAVTGHPNENHGPLFLSWASHCAEKVGFPIPKTDNLTDLELTSAEHVLTTVVLRTMNGVWHGLFYSGTFFDNPRKMNELMAVYGRPGKMKEGEKFMVVKVQSTLIQKYGQSKAINQKWWVKISQKEVDEVLQKGQILRQIEPGSVPHEFAQEHLPTKEVLVLLRTNPKTGAVQGCFYMPTNARNPQKLNDLYRNNYLYENSGWHIELFTTVTTIFNRGFSMNRDVNKGTYYNLKPETVAELRRNAKPIKFGFHPISVNLPKS